VPRKSCKPGASDHRRIADLGRQGYRLDASRPVRSSADLDAASSTVTPASRRGAADEQRLREVRAGLRDQHRGSRAAEHGGRAVVGIAGLQVTPARRSNSAVAEINPISKGRKLHRMPPAVLASTANIQIARFT